MYLWTENNRLLFKVFCFTLSSIKDRNIFVSFTSKFTLRQGHSSALLLDWIFISTLKQCTRTDEDFIYHNEENKELISKRWSVVNFASKFFQIFTVNKATIYILRRINNVKSMYLKEEINPIPRVPRSSYIQIKIS